MRTNAARAVHVSAGEDARTMAIDRPMDRVFLRVRSLMQSIDAVQEPGSPQAPSAASRDVRCDDELRFNLVAAVNPGRHGRSRAAWRLESVDAEQKVGASRPTLRVVEQHCLTHSVAKAIDGAGARDVPQAIFAVENGRQAQLGPRVC